MSEPEPTPSRRDRSGAAHTRKLAVISMAVTPSTDPQLPATRPDGRRSPAHPPSRRRPTPAQYRRRRVLALVLALALVAGISGIGRALFGGDPTSSAAPAATGPATAAPESAALDTAAADSSVESTVPVTETVPAANVGVPSADNPVKMYVAGDSDAGTFGPYLQTLMKKTGMVDVTLDYKVSTGLARPDFFDWPARFDEEVPKVNPGIVVITFGGNDAQGLSDKSGTFIFGTPTGDATADAGWREEYGKRVGQVMDTLTQGGRTLIWVGIPNDDNPEVTNADGGAGSGGARAGRRSPGCRVHRHLADLLRSQRRLGRLRDRPA